MLLTRRESLAILSAGICVAATPALKSQWQQIAGEIDGTVGAAALHLGTNQMVSLNGDERFPLASVCKLPIAIHILAMIDEGHFSLDQLIEIPLNEVVPGVSPVADRWPKEKRFPLSELVELMVAKSDNTAVETFFRLGGGEPGFSKRFRQWGITGIRIDRSERRCGLDAAGVTKIPPAASWTPDTYQKLTAPISQDQRVAALRRFIEDPRDTGTPNATIQLLRKLYAGELLSKPLTARMQQILQNTTTGPNRLKGMLPPGVIVAHKTGTTETFGGLNGATNDAGVIITLPNGADRVAIAVYVKGSTRDQAAREKVIAKIAQAAATYW